LCASWFAKWRKIWENKDIVVVEGAGTHSGVGNDLFDTASSIIRIICPPKNAIDVYDEILTACKGYSKDRLFLISLGPAAKFLVEDLYNDRYRVLDIGQVDMEYEWFLQKAEIKIPVAKHNIMGEEANRSAGYHNYLEEIDKIIGIIW
jgi:glycosyltransferase family protein